MCVIEAILLHEGALEEERVFHSQEALDAWCDQVLEAGGEVYVIEHNHPLEEECECVQYLQDHRPYRKARDA